MNGASKPFQRIIVAYDDSPAAEDALRVGLELCKLIGAPLETLTAIEVSRVYSELVPTSSAEVVQRINSDRLRNYQELMDVALVAGRNRSVAITGHLIEIQEIDGIASFLRSRNADLLVIGLQQNSCTAGRLWSRVSRLEHEMPCGVLAIRTSRMNVEVPVSGMELVQVDGRI